jgi:hypothetical protein
MLTLVIRLSYPHSVMHCKVYLLAKMLVLFLKPLFMFSFCGTLVLTIQAVEV